MPEDPPSNLHELLSDWHRRLRESQFSNYAAAEHYARKNTSLGLPVVVLAAVVGSSVVATAQSDLPSWLQVLIGCLSLLASVLAGVQTYFGFSERAEKHRAAGARYGAIRREVEQAQAADPATIAATIDAIRGRIDTLAEEAPNVPPDLWKKALRTISEQTT